MAKTKTVNIDLSNKGFIKITHEDQEPYENKYIQRDGVCVSFKKVYDEGLTIPAIVINGDTFRFDCILSPSDWTPDDDGVEASVEDIEEWLTPE